MKNLIYLILILSVNVNAQIDSTRINVNTQIDTECYNQDYQKKQTIELVAVAAINLATMIILLDKPNWTVSQQALRTPLLLFMSIGFTLTVADDYRKRRNDAYITHYGTKRHLMN